LLLPHLGTCLGLKGAYESSLKHDTPLTVAQCKITGLFILGRRGYFSSTGDEDSKHCGADPGSASTTYTQLSRVKANHSTGTTHRYLMVGGGSCRNTRLDTRLRPAHCTSLSTLHVVSVQQYIVQKPPHWGHHEHQVPATRSIASNARLDC